MKKLILFALLSNTFSAFSATEQTLWMAPSDKLATYQITLSAQGTLQQLKTTTASHYALVALADHDENTMHERYNITYNNIPIWGRQLIVHHQGKQGLRLSGTLITGIESDLNDTRPRLTSDVAFAPILAQVNTPIKAKSTRLIIYMDEHKSAQLAYLISFFTHNPLKSPTYPHYIINANTGIVLKQWDEIKSSTVGQGPGGNTTSLPYRAGSFQYGKAQPNVPSLGTFPMSHWLLWCSMETPNYRVINLKNQWVSESKLGYVFPVYDSEEKQMNLTAVSASCLPWTGQFNNQDDEGYSPVNGAASPINDAMYFVNQTFELYKSLGIKNPLGTKDLPLRVFTHINGFDNAFALPTFYVKNSKTIKAHQQIVLGNGLSYFTALTQTIIGHELSHNFTGLNSGLIYFGQSGGINEAFSDIASIAIMDFIRNKYPFYWDGEDWTIGREATKDGTPLRYLEHPTQDGMSIEHADQYKSTLNVHFTSGVFNRAFYLLAHQPGWSIRDAFQVMVDANKNYWEPNSTFNSAACGVIQAAQDRHLNKEDVIQAFKEVGVACSNEEVSSRP